MSKKIQLHIPEPCHEDWDKMTPSSQGRFCSSCQKQVIDFSRMSDREIAQFFKKPSTGSVCGRFMKDQLDRDIQMDKKRLPWIKYFFQLVLPAFLVTKQARAQGGCMMIIEEITKTEAPKPGKIKIEMKIPATRLKVTILDSISGAGVGYASINVAGTRANVISNALGEVQVPFKKGMKTITLTITAAGYQSLSITEALDPAVIKNGIAVRLNKEVIEPRKEMVLACGFRGIKRDTTIVVKPADSTRTIDDTTKGITDTAKLIANTIKTLFNFVPKTFKVYPSPVMGGTRLYVELGKQEKGPYMFELVSISGSIVSRKEILVDDRISIVEMGIPAIPAGVYFLNISRKDGDKKFSKEIIIQ